MVIIAWRSLQSISNDTAASNQHLTDCREFNRSAAVTTSRLKSCIGLSSTAAAPTLKRDRKIAVSGASCTREIEGRILKLASPSHAAETSSTAGATEKAITRISTARPGTPLRWFTTVAATGQCTNSVSGNCHIALRKNRDGT
jgi:hypothetical protein